MAYSIDWFKGSHRADTETWPATNVSTMKNHARTIVQSGDADRVEIRDDAGKLVFHYPRIMHVMPNGSMWSVRSSGALRASRRFATQGEAIARARDIAQKEKTVLYIHGRDGRIRERNSYSAALPSSG